jgi:hypothetical protein
MMAAMHVRVCVECKEEYRPEVTRCADCGGALQDRYENDEGDDESDPAPEAAAPEAQAEAEEPLVLAHAIATSASARELVPLADGLLEAGIEFRIVAREVEGEGRPRGYELQVPDADRGKAIEAVADLVGSEGGVTLLALTIRARGPEEDAESELLCPGCDTPVDPSATECPECGLGLSG